ncbi:MAG: LacI family DNA-binding transcriptional regulator, partial [Acidimicrobiia bacterium]
RVDGMILATASRSDAAIEALDEEGVSVVLVNRSSEGVSVPAIVGDDHAGIGLAVEHLAKLGHRRIGHLAGPSHLSTGIGRRQAFVAWMRTVGLDTQDDDVEEADWYQVQPGFEATARLLQRVPDLTALVAANDLIALGAYRAIRETGREVGVDVSVTGYNDIPLLDLMQPALTSVRVPYRQMGVEAARALLSLMTEDEAGDRPVSIRLTPTLSVRASTAPPRA